MATAGLATGIVGVSFGSLAAFVFVAVFLAASSATPDDGADVAAIEGQVLGRNLDADAAREVSVAVAAWDNRSRYEPLTIQGTATVVLEESADGAAWQAVANRALDLRPARGLTMRATTFSVDFAGVEVEDTHRYRAHVTVRVDATGRVFEDLSQAEVGGRLPGSVRW